MPLNDALVLADLVDDLHEKYDELLGGLDTRSWRELLVYCTAQLTKTGAEVGDVIVFLLEYFQLATEGKGDRPS